MKNTNDNLVKVNEADINFVAYEKWEKAGRPDGQDVKFWLDAEAQLRAMAKTSLATPPAPVPQVSAKPATAPKAAETQPVPSRPKSVKPAQKARRR